MEPLSCEHRQAILNSVSYIETAVVDRHYVVDEALGRWEVILRGEDEKIPRLVFIVGVHERGKGGGISDGVQAIQMGAVEEAGEYCVKKTSEERAWLIRGSENEVCPGEGLAGYGVRVVWLRTWGGLRDGRMAV